jgi:hypothetical protein
MLPPQTIIIQETNYRTFSIQFIYFTIILLSFQFRWILVLSLIAVRYISVWIIVGFQQIN